MTDDGIKGRQSIPKPGFRQIRLGHYQAVTGLITHVVYGLDTDGRVWKYNELTNAWEPLGE